jgi:hypothetical protein
VAIGEPATSVIATPPYVTPVTSSSVEPYWST